MQTGASDGSTQQVAAKAKNTIDGQLNFPDPEHGPKPQVLVQQFQQKFDVSALTALMSMSWTAQSSWCLAEAVVTISVSVMVAGPYISSQYCR